MQKSVNIVFLGVVIVCSASLQAVISNKKVQKMIAAANQALDDSHATVEEVVQGLKGLEQTAYASLVENYKKRWQDRHFFIKRQVAEKDEQLKENQSLRKKVVQLEQEKIELSQKLKAKETLARGKTPLAKTSSYRVDDHVVDDLIYIMQGAEGKLETSQKQRQAIKDLLFLEHTALENDWAQDMLQVLIDGFVYKSIPINDLYTEHKWAESLSGIINKNFSGNVLSQALNDCLMLYIKGKQLSLSKDIVESFLYEFIYQGKSLGFLYARDNNFIRTMITTIGAFSERMQGLSPDSLVSSVNLELKKDILQKDRDNLTQEMQQLVDAFESLKERFSSFLHIATQAEKIDKEGKITILFDQAKQKKTKLKNLLKEIKA